MDHSMVGPTTLMRRNAFDFDRSPFDSPSLSLSLSVETTAEIETLYSRRLFGFESLSLFLSAASYRFLPLVQSFDPFFFLRVKLAGKPITNATSATRLLFVRTFESAFAD